jgi:hypothetical protein
MGGPFRSDAECLRERLRVAEERVVQLETERTELERMCERRPRRRWGIVLVVVSVLGVAVGFTGMALDAAHEQVTQRQLKAQLAEANDRLERMISFDSQCIRSGEICRYCPL